MSTTALRSRRSRCCGRARCLVFSSSIPLSDAPKAGARSSGSSGPCVISSSSNWPPHLPGRPARDAADHLLRRAPGVGEVPRRHQREARRRDRGEEAPRDLGDPRRSRRLRPPQRRHADPRRFEGPVRRRRPTRSSPVSTGAGRSCFRISRPARGRSSPARPGRTTIRVSRPRATGSPSSPRATAASPPSTGCARTGATPSV